MKTLFIPSDISKYMKCYTKKDCKRTIKQMLENLKNKFTPTQYNKENADTDPKLFTPLSKVLLKKYQENLPKKDKLDLLYTHLRLENYQF